MTTRCGGAANRALQGGCTVSYGRALDRAHDDTRISFLSESAIPDVWRTWLGLLGVRWRFWPALTLHFQWQLQMGQHIVAPAMVMQH